MELTEIQRKSIQDIGDAHHLRFIILYGSQAREQGNARSDIDIAVSGEEGLSTEALSELFQKFEQVFRGSEIDLKSLHRAGILFRYQVTKDGILLYGDPFAFSRYKVYALNTFIDAQDLFRLQEMLIKKRLGMAAVS